MFQPNAKYTISPNHCTLKKGTACGQTSVTDACIMQIWVGNEDTIIITIGMNNSQPRVLLQDIIIYLLWIVQTLCICTHTRTTYKDTPTHLHAVVCMHRVRSPASCCGIDSTSLWQLLHSLLYLFFLSFLYGHEMADGQAFLQV